MTAGLEPLRVEQPREVSTSPRRTFSSGVLTGGLACCGLVAMVALFNKNALFQQSCAGAPHIDKFFGVGAWNPSLTGSTRAVPGTPVMTNMAKGKMTSGNVKRATIPEMAQMAEMGDLTFEYFTREWRWKLDTPGKGQVMVPALKEVWTLWDDYRRGFVFNNSRTSAVENFYISYDNDELEKDPYDEYKLSITVPIEEAGAWESDDLPRVNNFIEKLADVHGLRLPIVTQTMTDTTL